MTRNALILIAITFATACGNSSGAKGNGADAGTFLNLNGGGSGDGGSSGSGGSGGNGGAAGLPDASSAQGSFSAPDCMSGCATFPGMNAGACSSSAPAIKLVYPIDGVLVPPNMNVITVQWTPFGSAYSEFEVDFSNTITDVRAVTKCSYQTMDTSQPPQASGGCEFTLTPQQWATLANANRGGNPVKITVRGTTDGKCASSSQNSVSLSFASEDVLGAIYYWKSTISSNGTGGQIWVKSFGDTNPEQQVTGVAGSALSASCNGCHVLSRDGTRMVVYSDDDDSDDEYSDVTGSLIDMTTKMAIGTAYAGRGTGQNPGFSTISPTHASYLTSDGLGSAGTGATNVFTLWNGNTGMQQNTPITVGSAGQRPTMPDWSPDGTSIVFVVPQQVATWDQGGGTGFTGARNDDDHEFGGSLYTLPYMGNNQFGTPSAFLTSNGENNYYPSYSPDGAFIVFDRAPKSTSVSALDGCVGNSPEVSCPNDSFSNPAARLMLVANTPGSAPIDLQKANGSAAAAPVSLSNSWPRWSPFVQMYRGTRLLWVAFSSTRDYGILVRNHLVIGGTPMYQCYPADSYQLAGGSHHATFAPQCQQPKLWMAAINLTESGGVDPSFPAFYLPFQDITTHNHTPQWTQEVVTMPMPDAGTCIPAGQSCQQDPSACCAPAVCTGNGTCGAVVF